MMTRGVCDTLTAQFEELQRERGLVDVKFLLRDLENATTESVCREVNSMLDNYLSGKVEPMLYEEATC